jgi:ankyrin repeat protein
MLITTKMLYFVASGLKNWAVRFEAYTLLEVLVELNDNAKYYEDRGGFNLLHLAALGGYSNIVKTIFKNEEIDINEKTKEGDSAIHLASLQDNSVVVDSLLRNNAKIIDDAGQDKMSPIHVAAANGNKSVLKVIFERYIADKREEAKKLKQEVKFDKESVTNQMLALQDHSGKTALHHASINGHMDVIKLIFSYGYRTSSKQDQNKRYTNCHLL